MTECEWKGGCTSAATRLVGPWQVCSLHFRDALDGIRAQAAESEKVRTWVDRVLFTSDPDGDEIRVRLPRPRQRPDPNQALVYFVQREGLVKIGISSNVEKRVNEIGRGSSMPPGMTVGPVKLLGTVAGGRRREGQLHDQFQAAHFWGEWFRAVPELIGFIKQEAEY